MGYIFVIVLGAALLLILFIGFMSGAKKPPTGQLPVDEAKPKGQPSADAPTPAASAVESNQQVENARRHTPAA